MPVSLQNVEGRMRDFNLDHPDCYAAGLGQKVRRMVLTKNPKTGKEQPRENIRLVPGSLLFLAHETKQGLPLAVLQAPAVLAAIRAGTLKIISQTADLPFVDPQTATPVGLPESSMETMSSGKSGRKGRD
jgi:hypothetical protein